MCWAIVQADKTEDQGSLRDVQGGPGESDPSNNCCILEELRKEDTFVFYIKHLFIKVNTMNCVLQNYTRSLIEYTFLAPSSARISERGSRNWCVHKLSLNKPLKQY